ncbi:MAG: Gfo/Idh/MocA family protein [Candidatus Cyclobacteriaceae bacterium M3_2C_046]
MTNRRSFLKKVAVGATGISLGTAVSAKSYGRIIGANDRLNVAFMGCGRRVPAYYNAVTDKNNNVELGYICDVMKSQREKTAAALNGKLTNKPALVEDIRVVLDDPNVDAIFNATPDHWHAPGTWIALDAGKHVYVEKPCSHNPYEGELLVHFQKKYDKVVQMGNQQRSAPESIDIINQIHNGAIGKAYKAVAFYSNARGEVVNPTPAPVPEGLNWELFQGPAPHESYKHDTWNYNWHWYGWNWGTAETGNNATHELDVARWALQVAYPQSVQVEAEKRHFKDDGWTMYDTMDATFVYPGDLIIKWDGKSRNGYDTYGSGRGTIIYGTDGSVYVDRGGYKLFDRRGKMIKESKSASEESGTALGGGGDMSTLHVVNFFDAIRGKAEQRSPIDEGAISVHLCHLANIAYRVDKPLEVDISNGHIYDRDAMKLWRREYEPGWEPNVGV